MLLWAWFGNQCLTPEGVRHDAVPAMVDFAHIGTVCDPRRRGRNLLCGAGAPDDDYDGYSRPQGAGHDIGAFEYGTIIFADGFESANTSV